MAEIRKCRHCNDVFKAKKSQIDAGTGHYCSHKCAYEGKNKFHLSSRENLEKANAARANVKAKHKTGPGHHMWKGGPSLYNERYRERQRAYTKEYRKKNPHMMRESARKRTAQKKVRLPRGTVKRIGEHQKWRCITCRCDISQGFHLDHITPLARGGKHAPYNLQLLCGPCNLRKSDKDPIDFMQSLGFLL